MKTNYSTTAASGLLLSLAALTLPPVSNLHAAEIFTGVTLGTDVGYSRGGAWGDYDNDGFIDLFVANLGPGGVGSASHFFYHNNRDGTFSRVTTGPVAAAFSAGGEAVWGDYDNNGYLDLVVVNNNQPNYLFHNHGDGSFAEVASSLSSDIDEHRSVTWVDYDNDGYVDIFSTAGVVGQFDVLRHLHHNNHDGTFTRITEGDFLTSTGAFFGVAWGDYNNDGRPDLFLPQASQDSSLPVHLYRNDGGGTFARVGAGADGNFNSIAAAWADYDNDGDLDLFVSRGWFPGPVRSRPNVLYRNDGNDTFTSVTTLPANDPEYQGGASFGCNWGDYDNDGWLDLFVVNYDGQNNFLYHNNGDGTFTKVLDSIAVTAGGDSRSTAWGDYDNDGFLDLFVSNTAGTNFLYHNDGNANHWIEFRLIGTRSNRAAIGAKVRVQATINGQLVRQMREVPGGDGLMGQNSLFVHVGLGNATTADLVRIEWPSGAVQELQNVAANEFHTVTEPPLLTSRRVNGEIQLTVTGRQGSHYELGTSTDLINWSWDIDDMVTPTDPSGTVTFPAPVLPGNMRGFYRVR